MNYFLEIAIKASLEAGEKIMKIYSSGDFDYEMKDDSSPLTIADKNANEIINQYLLKTDIPIISEENAQLAYKERKKWDRCWIVDPLDGTKEFIKKNGEFTVNIALVDNGVPVLGVIYAPDSRKLYYADVLKEEAYFLKVASENISMEAIVKSSKRIQYLENNDGIIRIVGSRSHMNIETSDFINSLKRKYGEVEIIPKGSSLKFCLVAEGKADVYPRFAPTMEWDTAAAHAICNASGVSVISNETNKELSYNKENLLNPWFICRR